MARHVIGNPPFDVVTIDRDEPLNIGNIDGAMAGRLGITLCIRSANGHPRRGGYFFHIERADPDYLIRDFEGNVIGSLNRMELVRFINHVSGRQFDQSMLTYCQSVVNFRQDQTAPDLEP